MEDHGRETGLFGDPSQGRNPAGKIRLPNTDPQKSARSCGCDPGANHVCEGHQIAASARRGCTGEDFTRKPLPVAAKEPWRPRDPGPKSPVLPVDAKLRKEYPIFTGVLQYFPDAIAEVAHVSFIGNQQHNPGQPLHWARGKSMDQEDTMIRHAMEAGTRDIDGQRHSAKAAWRALAILQLEIEREREEGEIA